MLGKHEMKAVARRYDTLQRDLPMPAHADQEQQHRRNDRERPEASERGKHRSEPGRGKIGAPAGAHGRFGQLRKLAPARQIIQRALICHGRSV